MDQPNLPRPDVDIEQEIVGIIRSYPPLKVSRPHFEFQSTDGHVRFKGNIRTPQERTVLENAVRRISGVKSVDCSQLIDDEMVRFHVGHLLPPGVFATVHLGGVALTGHLPQGADAATLMDMVSHTPGVRVVRADLQPAVAQNT